MRGGEGKGREGRGGEGEGGEGRGGVPQLTCSVGDTAGATHLGCWDHDTLVTLDHHTIQVG